MTDIAKHDFTRYFILKDFKRICKDTEKNQLLLC